MGRPKQRKLCKADSTNKRKAQATGEVPVISCNNRDRFISVLLSPTLNSSIIGKISQLLANVSTSAHRHTEVQMFKETLSEAIQDIYSKSLARFIADVRQIQLGELKFEDKFPILDCKLLDLAMGKLLQLDDSKEVYHLTFIQVNWFVDQLIRIIRGLEGLSSSILMAAVTRAWNVTRVAAESLDKFLYQLFETEKSVTDFTCMILNKQILIEKLRKEPIIIALNQKSEDWENAEYGSLDEYEGMSIDQIVCEIEEPLGKPKEIRPEGYLEDFRIRLEREPVPPNKVRVRCSESWLLKIRNTVFSKFLASTN